MAEAQRRLRVVLADDEPLARATLRGLLAEDPALELVAECKNGGETLAAVRKHGPDLLLLDVQMPGMGGFEVLEDLEPPERPVVVFVTAYDRYAVRAFEVHALDFVLKPFDDERFRKALARAKERARVDAALAGRELGELLETLAQDAGREADAPVKRLVIRREGRVEVIDTDRIVWVEAADQYVVLHTDDGDVLMRESMNRLEQDLDPTQFLRIHRSAIIALGHLRALDRSTGAARVLVDADTWLPVSRSRLQTLKAHLA